MPTYAHADDVSGYIEGFVVDDPAALDRLLERAERYVDGLLKAPVSGTRQPTGLKYDPATLEVWKAEALARATSAQVEYMLEMGDEFFVQAQHQSVRGPEFSTTGQLPYIGPKVRHELDGTLLLKPCRAGSAITTQPDF